MGPVFSSESIATAAHDGDRKLMKRLIKIRGLRELNKKVQIGNLVCTPLEFAIHGDHTNVLQAILKHRELLPVHEIERSLILASELGHLRVLKMLLEAGVNIEYCELGYHHRHTPLVAAVHSGHTKVISALLEHQPTLNVKEEFLLACHLGKAEVVKLLLTIGGDIAHKQCGKMIPELIFPGCNGIEYAVYAGQVEIVDILLKHEQPKPAGMLVKALGLAIREKQEEIVKMITAAGADVKDLFLTDGFEVLRGAIDTGNTYLLQELVQASTAATAKHDQLHRAVYAGHFEAARFLIIYGAETQLAYTWDMSKVHPRICTMLMETGAHANDTQHASPTKVKKDFPLLLKRYKCPEARWEYRHIMLCARGVPARIDWAKGLADAEAAVVAIQAEERDYTKSEPQRKALEAVQLEESFLLTSQAEYDTLLDRRRKLVTFLDTLCESQEAGKDLDSLAITKHMRESLSKLDLSMLPDNPYCGLPPTPPKKRASAGHS